MDQTVNQKNQQMKVVCGSVCYLVKGTHLVEAKRTTKLASPQVLCQNRMHTNSFAHLLLPSLLPRT